MPKILSFDRKNFLSFDSLLELYNSWLDQPLLTNSSPTFENVYVTDKVGIGTTNPSGNLHIRNGTVFIENTDDTFITMTTISNSKILHLGFDTDVDGGASYLANQSNKDLYFVTNNLERIRIKNSGNVGIGTHDPTTYKLQVQGDFNFTGDLYQNGSLFSGSQWVTTGSDIYYSTGNVGIGTNNPASYKLNVNGNALVQGSLEMTTSGSGSSAFSLTPTASGYNNSALYINTPNTAGSSAFNLIDARSQGSYKFLVRGDGNVGINTSSPQYTLDVRNTPTCDISFKSGWSSEDINLYFGTHVTGGVSKGLIVSEGLNSAGRSKFHFCLNNNADDFTGQASLSDSRMVITYDGRVGVGTTTPNYTLEVIGDINFTGDLYDNGVLFSGGSSQWTTTGSDIYYTTGDVGIGTNAPAYKLDVVGDINFTGNLKFNGSNISFGGGTQWTTVVNDIYYTTGNIGIGTTDPGTNRLRVNGNLYATGNVGFGTDPDISYRLHVDGDINTTSQIKKNGVELVLVDLPTINITDVSNFVGSPTINVPFKKYFKLENITGSKTLILTIEIPSNQLVSNSTTSVFDFDIPNVVGTFTNTYDATFAINGYTDDSGTIVNLENCMAYCVGGTATGRCSFTSGLNITTESHVLQITVYY